MDNKKLKITALILSIIAIGLITYLIYNISTKKDLSNVNNNTVNQNNDKQEEQNNIENNNQDDIEKDKSDNQSNINKNDNSNSNVYEYVYGIYAYETDGEAYLFLWDDKTFEYRYELKDKNEEGYLGTYEIKDNYLILNKKFNMYEKVYNTYADDTKTSSSKVITEQSVIKMKINSKRELYDEENKIVLNAQTAQTFGPGNDFYSNLSRLINIPLKDNDNYNEEKDIMNNIDDNVKDFYGVFGMEAYDNINGNGDLILWGDKTFRYSYTLKNKNEEEYLGTYEIKDNYLILNNMFEIDFGSNVTASEDDTAKIITEPSTIKIKIESRREIYDENNKIKLVRYSQSAYEGGCNFYTDLGSLLKRIPTE